MNKEEFLSKIAQLSLKNYIYIVGCGNFGKRIGEWLDYNGIDWNGYIDKVDCEKQIYNKPILKYNYTFDENSIFIISSEYHKDSMIANLHDNGIMKEKIIDNITRDIVYDFIQELYDSNIILERNKSYYNIHENKRCFIIGNGPSLTINDLDMLKNEFSFGCNAIYALYKKTSWRPTYYCAADAGGCRLYFNTPEILDMLIRGSQGIFASIATDAFSYRNNYNNLFFFKTKFSYDGLLPKFSDDICDGLYASGTITYFMLQIAIYMGFKQIYLLGIDFSFSCERDNNGNVKLQSVINHPKEIEEAEKTLSEPVKKVYGYDYVADIDKQLYGYQAAKKYADSHGIKIYNATRGGKLEVFPRVDFDSLFDK